MKASELTDKVLDKIVISLLSKRSGFGLVYPMASTWEIASELWRQHRVFVRKDADIVKEKMRAWWKKKPTVPEPYPHKMIGKYPVYLTAPMNRTYCILEKPYGSLIIWDNHMRGVSKERRS